MSHSTLLVGGNTGIGLATARLPAARGDRLCAAARSPGPLESLGIPVQPFDALNPTPIRVSEPLDGLMYFPGSISLKPFHRLTALSSIRTC